MAKIKNCFLEIDSKEGIIDVYRKGHDDPFFRVYDLPEDICEDLLIGKSVSVRLRTSGLEN